MAASFMLEKNQKLIIFAELFSKKKFLMDNLFVWVLKYWMGKDPLLQKKKLDGFIPGFLFSFITPTRRFFSRRTKSGNKGDSFSLI